MQYGLFTCWWIRKQGQAVTVKPGSEWATAASPALYPTGPAATKEPMFKHVTQVVENLDNPGHLKQTQKRSYVYVTAPAWGHKKSVASKKEEEEKR